MQCQLTVKKAKLLYKNKLVTLLGHTRFEVVTELLKSRH